MLTDRRVSYDFVVRITETCLDPIGKTHLYHIIGTTHRSLEQWLNLAIRLKLIKAIDNNKYQTTQKGKNFLNAWANVQTFLKEEAT